MLNLVLKPTPKDTKKTHFAVTLPTESDPITTDSSPTIVRAEDGDHTECEGTRVQILDAVSIEKRMVSVLTGGHNKKPHDLRAALKSINTDKKKFKDTATTTLTKNTKLTSYECQHCAEVFTTSKEFKYHCLNKHGVTHPYKCEHCDNVYTHKAALNVHLRTHSNDRPFSCDECGRSFSQSSTLASHVLRHAGATPHICDVCGKSFVLKGELRTHYRIHLPTKPFSCNECGLSFPRKSNFTRHMRKHTGEKPYGCKFCSKTFARSENRDEHQRTHTNERPYVCQLCGARFSDSGNFSKHKRLHSTSNTTRRRRFRVSPPVETLPTMTSGDKLCALDELTPQAVDNNNQDDNDKNPNQSWNARIETKRKDEEDSAVSMTISLIQKPPASELDNAAKPLPQLLVTMPPPDQVIKPDHVTGFIKLSDTLIVAPPKDMENPPVDSKLSASNDFTYQYSISGLLNTQSTLPTVLNYASVNQSYNMMLDYSRDTSFSMNNDAGLILPDTSFTRDSSNPLTGTDDYIYGASMAPHELTERRPRFHDVLFTREDSGGTSLASASQFNMENSSSADERQPLDTSKFLNEQYLLKNDENLPNECTENSISNDDKHDN